MTLHRHPGKTMNHHSVITQRAGLLLAALAACALLTACGSSSSTTKKSTGASSSTSSTASSGRGRFLADRAKLTSCLKQHGVTLPTFHRPSASASGPPAGGGFFGARAGAGRFHGGAFANPKLRAALKACGANFPHRTRAFTRSAAFKNRLDSFVACVKKNGYTLPKPNLSGKGPVFPVSIEKNSKFQAASKACASALRRPAGGGTTSSSG